MKARRATALLTAVAALAACAPAHADGDPASDVLLFQDAYLPYFPKPGKAEAETLERLLREVEAKGYETKVAVILTRGDLGAYPDLFGKPQDYATLLASEITFRVRNPHLLIVMGEGGLAGLGLGPDAQAILDDIEIEDPTDADSLVRAAIEAVARIASANGHPVEVPEIEEDAEGGRGSDHGGESHLALYVVSGVIVALGLVLILLSFRIRARPAQG